MVKGTFISLLILITSFTTLSAETAQKAIPLLRELDRAIGKRTEHLQAKENKIQNLVNRLYSSISDENRFEILGQLVSEYSSYNSDKAFSYALDREKLAIKMGDSGNIAHARMDLANLMCFTGMYKESMEIIQDISPQSLPDELHPYYYHLNRSIYGYMADYAVTFREKEAYTALTDSYRDSLILAYDDNPFFRNLVQADQHNVHRQYDKAINLLTETFKTTDNKHNKALVAYTMSESYRLKGDVDREMEWLAISAIYDIEASVKDYISLRRLAVLLFNKGDIKRAYAYMTVSLEDAAAANARLRMIENLEMFPIINATYNQHAAHQKKLMAIALILISILSAFLFIASYYIYVQMKKVAAARKELEAANHIILENSYLKETYIARYMDQCSIYIERMDKNRKLWSKMLNMGNKEELSKILKSSSFINDELKEFYSNFDHTFLLLFPNFIEEFNALLIEEERIYPKQGELMSPALRVYALIRLGITDSVKIAQFLRYSVTTIYNYRTTVRNKALGDRNLFEGKVMKIGKIE